MAPLDESEYDEPRPGRATRPAWDAATYGTPDDLRRWPGGRDPRRESASAPAYPAEKTEPPAWEPPAWEPPKWDPPAWDPPTYEEAQPDESRWDSSKWDPPAWDAPPTESYQDSSDSYSAVHSADSYPADAYS